MWMEIGDRVLRTRTLERISTIHQFRSVWVKIVHSRTGAKATAALLPGIASPHSLLIRSCNEETPLSVQVPLPLFNHTYGLESSVRGTEKYCPCHRLGGAHFFQWMYPIGAMAGIRSQPEKASLPWLFLSCRLVSGEVGEVVILGMVYRRVLDLFLGT